LEAKISPDSKMIGLQSEQELLGIITRPLIEQYESYAEKFSLIYDVFVNFELSDLRNKPMDDMKSIFLQYEELFYSIAEINNLHNQFPIRGTLRKRYSIADFMNDFEENYEMMVKKASHVRQIFATYSQFDESNFLKIIEDIFN
jgi:hypothetical protein